MPTINWKDVCKNLRDGKKVTVRIPTSTAGVDSNITITPLEGDRAKLSGYAIDTSTGRKMDEWHNNMHRSCATVYNIEMDVGNLSNAIASKAAKILVPKVERAKKERIVNNIASTLQFCFKEEDISLAGNPAWADSTRESTIKYLLCSIVPRMDAIGSDISDEDMIMIRKELIDHAYHSGRRKKKKDGDFNQKDMDTAANSVDQYLYRAAILYRWVRKNHPEYEIPDVQFPDSVRSKRIKTEQAKALPDDIRIRIYTIFKRLAKAGVTLAYGAAMMYLCGLRTAEAAAPLIGEIYLNPSGKFGYYLVAHQVRSGTRTRTKYLKRKASYRIVILSHEMVLFVLDRIDQLRTAGFTDDEINRTPLVSASDGDFIDSSDLSTFVMAALRAAGCNNEFLAAAATLIYQEPDYDEDGKPTMDLGAYILRRDWCSRVCNTCGLDPVTVDALIGHENPKSKGLDFTTPERQAEIARQLERYVFDPTDTLNPKFTPIVISMPANIDLAGNMEYCITAEEDMELQIELLTLEPNDALHLLGDSDLVISNIHVSAPLDRLSNRKGRPILGFLYSTAFYDKLINEANSVSIDPIIKKYSVIGKEAHHD